MLGTGNAFAKKYYNNNALLRSNGYQLMIDCGITAPAALYRIGQPLDEIDAVLVTHIHADHIGGLEEYAFRMKFEYKKHPVLYVPSTLVHPLWEHSLKGGLSQGEWQSIADFFEVRLLEEGKPTVITDGLAVEIIQTEHIPDKLSYSLLFNNRFFYSSDMRFNPELVTSLVRDRGAVVFHDCQLTNPGAVHATLDELLTLPDDVQEHVYLMHYSDNKPSFEGKSGRMAFIEQHVVYTIADGKAIQGSPVSQRR